MKRLLSLALVLSMVISLFGVIAVSAASDDILMLYDGERETGNGAQEPWGSLAGCDTYYYTQGESGYAMQSYYNGVYLFQNTVTYLGYAPDISGYDYIEFDIMSYYGLTCDLELSTVRNTTSHHGSDYEMYDVYLPAETFVHVKMPIKDFVTRSPDNLDKYDSQNHFDPNDTMHFSGYALDHVERIRFQLTFCKTLEGEDCEDIYVVFDNVCATKNGATHTHGGTQPEVEDVQYAKDTNLDQTLADKVIAQIEALREGNKVGIMNAREAYEALTDAQKALVTNLSKLEALEQNKPITPEPPAVVDYGNVDGVGAPNAADALLVLQAAVRKIQLTDAQTVLADVDGNGLLNAADALCILQYAVGKINQFPVQGK